MISKLRKRFVYAEVRIRGGMVVCCSWMIFSYIQCFLRELHQLQQIKRATRSNIRRQHRGLTSINKPEPPDKIKQAKAAVESATAKDNKKQVGLLNRWAVLEWPFRILDSILNVKMDHTGDIGWIQRAFGHEQIMYTPLRVVSLSI